MKGTATAVAAAQPVIWTFLGYPFEGASMVAALSACLIVRVYLGFRGGARQEMAVNIAITCLTLLFTSGFIVTLRPSPFYAIWIGTGLGAIGAGLIKMAEKKARRLFDDDDDVVVGDGEAIRRLNEQVKDLP